ncbi:MAG: hypothetical protein A2X83_05595 [Desulfuromonadales bacterium GWD2_54_10]|nr:MAG: hypothetical protein A2X83_05595 [Desulfuromonadales bacterium GWD2_54_10]
MRNIMIMAFMFVLMTAYGVDAAEKSKTLSLIDATRGAIDGFVARAGENKAVAADVELARASLKKAEDAYEKGRQLFGFGDVKPEAELDIKHYAGLAELAISLGSSRIEKARVEVEFEALGKQLAEVKAKVKVFEDRKAEIDKLKADAAKLPIISKELEVIKSEKALLATQVELLMAERGQSDKLKAGNAELTRKIEELKAENARLTEQVEKMKAEGKLQAAQPLLKEPAKENIILKEPTAAKEAVTPKEVPAAKEVLQPAKDSQEPVAPKLENKGASDAAELPQVTPAEKK